MNKYKTVKQDYLKRTLPELPPWWVVSFSTSTGKNGVNVRTVVAMYAPFVTMHASSCVRVQRFSQCGRARATSLFPDARVATPVEACLRELFLNLEKGGSPTASLHGNELLCTVSACVAERALRSFQTHMCDATCNTCRSDHNNKYIRSHKQEARMNERQ